MEVPQDKPAPGSGDVYFVLEKATLEVAKVGKARPLRLRLRLRRGEDSSQGETAEPDPVALDRLLWSQEYVILNCDDHRNFLLKHHKDPADYRPDILHQARPPLSVLQPPR
jgi:EMG1/NEP1 methyltransferase